MIQKCSGCNFKFTVPECHKPNDMLFKYQVFRKYPNGKGEIKTAAIHSPAYFHSQDLGCLHELEELQNVQLKDLYIPNKTMDGLHKWHITKGKRCGTHLSTPHIRPSTDEAATALAHAEAHAATQTSMLTQHKPPALYIPHSYL